MTSKENQKPLFRQNPTEWYLGSVAFLTFEGLQSRRKSSFKEYLLLPMVIGGIFIYTSIFVSVFGDTSVNCGKLR